MASNDVKETLSRVFAVGDALSRTLEEEVLGILLPLMACWHFGGHYVQNCMNLM